MLVVQEHIAAASPDGLGVQYRFQADKALVVRWGPVSVKVLHIRPLGSTSTIEVKIFHQAVATYFVATERKIEVEPVMGLRSDVEPPTKRTVPGGTSDPFIGVFAHPLRYVRFIDEKNFFGERHFKSISFLKYFFLR